MAGCCQQRRLQSRWERYNVSISQSSGFSCQGNAVSDVSPLGNLSLFPSRYRAAFHGRGPHAVDRAVSLRHIVFPSRSQAASHFRFKPLFCAFLFQWFQSRYRAASHFRRPWRMSMRALSIMFQSRYRAASHFRCGMLGKYLLPGHLNVVSISLSSGFSFQVLTMHRLGMRLPTLRFNLVIERLLISGTP